MRISDCHHLKLGFPKETRKFIVMRFLTHCAELNRRKKTNMLRVKSCVCAGIISLVVSGCLFAQIPAATSRASRSSVTSSATKSTKIPKEDNAKYLIDIVQLQPPYSLTFPPDSCFPSMGIEFGVGNAADVAKWIGSEGFTLTAIPPDRIAIFYKSATPLAATLRDLEAKIQSLADLNFSKAVAVRVPVDSADKAVSNVKLPADGSITAEAYGGSCVVVLSKKQADPVAVEAVKKGISDFYWKQPSAPPVQRLFYVDATTVAKALAGSGEATGEVSEPNKKDTSRTSDSSQSKGASISGTANASTTVSPTVSVTLSSERTAASTKSDSSGEAAKIADTSDPHGSATGNNKDAKGKEPVDKPASGKGPSPESPQSKPPAITPINDMLVYSNADGSDRGIFERNRLIAVLDLPRPEVLMTIWSFQASSKDSNLVAREAEVTRQLVAQHNDLLQKAIDRGWDFLSRQMRQGGQFFEPLFYTYVTQKFAETGDHLDPLKLVSLTGPVASQFAAKEKEGELAQAQSGKNERKKLVEANRVAWGWCPMDKYCLGYSQAFEPLRPTFTNLLIGIVAARDPYTVAQKMIDSIENRTSQARSETPECLKKADARNPCVDKNSVSKFRACLQKSYRDLNTFAEQSADCEIEDRIVLTSQIVEGHERRPALNCFREQARISFTPVVSEESQYVTGRAGLLRAAIADFLFNYKWATQYPHDFIPYDLARSAQELNAEFNPLVLAFNRDVTALTEMLQSEVTCGHEEDKASFINDGSLSVRGISGVESLADTVTQSFFDATTPPSLTDLVKSVGDAEKNVPGVLKTNLTANEAAVLLGALNSVQTATAKIGRELKLDITPHSLAGASSAELEVKLTSQESADPSLYKSDKSTEDTLSRVAKHNVTTRVRVESLKLFDVSAFSATLQRPRSKFPIILPFVEVPYFGSFVGLPRNASKVFHRSTAVVSAVMVPTASDLAYGIDFFDDRVCDQNACQRAVSPANFGSLPLRNFHKAMVECLASGGRTPYAGRLTLQAQIIPQEEPTECSDLTFSKVPPSEYHLESTSPNN